MGEGDATGTWPFLKVYTLPLQAVLVCNFCYIVVCFRYCRSDC